MALSNGDFSGNGAFADVKLKFEDNKLYVYINDRQMSENTFYADKNVYEEGKQVVMTDGFYCRDGSISDLSLESGYKNTSILRAKLSFEDGTSEEVVFSTGSEERLYIIVDSETGLPLFTE